MVLLSPTAPAYAADKTLIDKAKCWSGELLALSCGRQGGRHPARGSHSLPLSSGRNPIEDLAGSLAEGIVSGRPDMPVYMFSPHDAQAIIEYLQSIQANRPALSPPRNG
ncbi:MAG TPA: hypothetical protein VED02_02100 [Methyloceanibacter sp.]|nr:hypothetical protein [Methyloceanibacter sp.]